MRINKLYLCSSSDIKRKHFEKFFIEKKIEIECLPIELPEVQAIDPDEVIDPKLALALKQTDLRPLLVDDVGLYIPALQNFPGALLKPIMEQGGIRLLRDLCSAHLKQNKIQAEFVCSIAIALANQNESELYNTAGLSAPHKGIRILRASGRMPGYLDFSNESHFEDRQCLRYFYPQLQTLSQNQDSATLSINTKSIYELQSIEPSFGFHHRFKALENLLLQLQPFI